MPNRFIPARNCGDFYSPLEGWLCTQRRGGMHLYFPPFCEEGGGRRPEGVFKMHPPHPTCTPQEGNLIQTEGVFNPQRSPLRLALLQGK